MDLNKRLKAGFSGWLDFCQINKTPKYLGGVQAQVLVYSKKSEKEIRSQLLGLVPDWQLTQLLDSSQQMYCLTGELGPIWLLFPQKQEAKANNPIEISLYTAFKNCLGEWTREATLFGIESISILFVNCKDEALLGGLVGIHVGSYRYKNIIENKLKPSFQLCVKKNKGIISKKIFDQSLARGQAINLARNLVNLSPQDLNPQSYAQFVQKLFRASKTSNVTVWDKSRLEKEHMNLLLAVGAASEHPPCLVHIKYRPQGSKNKKPIAFVGKGITFDTGGLNIKPSSSMRLMKKDMGGSAAVLGLACWVEASKLKQPCDFYLSLAENSISSSSFSPGDVLISRQGLEIEVHNTDAEGRLALADAIDVAINQKGKDKPIALIDVATLTGAIKAGLGSQIGGLFSNNTSLSQKLMQAAGQAGDYLWLMPLDQRLRSTMGSNFADMTNATDGFGGAITAALFLESFVGDLAWAHLDIYAWIDAPGGSLSEAGGSGQGVEALIEFMGH